jgi:superfamily II DNA or RNA helicase
VNGDFWNNAGSTPPSGGPDWDRDAEREAQDRPHEADREAQDRPHEAGAGPPPDPFVNRDRERAPRYERDANQDRQRSRRPPQRPNAPGNAPSQGNGPGQNARRRESGNAPPPQGNNGPPPGQGARRRERPADQQRPQQPYQTQPHQPPSRDSSLALAPKLLRDFAEGVRARGQSYFAKGRVSVTSSRAGEIVAAKVRGTTSYRVKLRMRGGRLHASCSCPYFAPDGVPCKHLWATILASDNLALLAAPPSRPLRLISDTPKQVDVEPIAGASPGDQNYPPFGPQNYIQGPFVNERGNSNDLPGQRPPGNQPAPRPNSTQRPAGNQGTRRPAVDHPAQRPPANRPAQRPPYQGQAPGYGSQGGYGSQPPGGGQKGYGPPQGYLPQGVPPQGPGSYGNTPGYGPQGGYAQGPQGQPLPPGPGQGRNQGRNQQINNNRRRTVTGNGPGAMPAQGNAPTRPGLPPQRPQQGQVPPGRSPGLIYVNGKPVAARPEPRPVKKVVNKQQVARNTKRLLIYVLDVPASLAQNQVVIDLARRERRPTGEWGPLRPWWHTPAGAPGRYDPEDRDLLDSLEQAQSSSNSSNHPETAGTRRYVVRPDGQADLVERLARSGRLRLRRADGEDDPPTTRWDDGSPWRFGIDIKCDPSGKRWTWRGSLRRNDPRGPGEQRMDLIEPLLIVPGLLALGAGRIARFDDSGVALWVARLRHEKELVLDGPQQDVMLGKVLLESRVAPAELVESLALVEVASPPQACLTLRTPRQNWGGPDRLLGELTFLYDGTSIPVDPPGRLAVRSELGLVIFRDEDTEAKAAIKLFELGFREAKDIRLDPGTLELPPKRMTPVSLELVAAGWRVEAEGKLIRPAGEFKLSVSSGIDWFELDGRVNFGDQSLSLPDVLAAAKRGDDMIQLGDGSMGVLPEAWIKQYGMIAEMGTTEDGHIRFGKAQVGLIDSLLAAQGEIKVDAPFAKVRQELRKFEGISPKEAPAGFRGELRPYQCEGLGWLEYLQTFDFGGILADDMGLGKTVQVLALLQGRRARRKAKAPSLIVVPRSLVFNWIQEATRFTPRLRVLDYTGPGRAALREQFNDHDLVVTTYGNMRSDIVELSQREFDYVILDEAQAIKNADSQASKAARLLRGRHRLAMSGTPIENHLGELWSIIEFLNPGMLGTASVFKRHTAGSAATDETARVALAKALKPFILRRTKTQVVKDLPEKTEQILHCDMEPAQRKTYEDLREHYRGALLRREAGEATRANNIEILEALLRLRQAACHPGLIDPSRGGEPSAKLDMLLPQLAEVIAEGHKVLIFSQFTKFLGLVRDRLEAENITYEYLDGQTRDRAERVERFQTDPTVPVFLISLKAGGLGLNLTSAGYVYLLDPWWNPAVEAQAIDRSHRIGQTQNVFAYRLICRDTVEQKILELQQKKRELAESILEGDGRLLPSLSRDDLEFLLS